MTLSELASVELHELDGLGQAAAACDVFDDLAVSDGLTGRAAERGPRSLSRLPLGKGARRISPLPLGEGLGVRAS